MKKFKTISSLSLLFFCGLVLFIIGLSISISPELFYSSNGIQLGDNTNLKNELRAPAGMLITAGAIILLSFWHTPLRSYAWLISTIVYLPYGLARLSGFVIDGMPHESLVIAALFELILGSLSFIMLWKKPSPDHREFELPISLASAQD